MRSYTTKNTFFFKLIVNKIN
uniref:Uncharacterized protein n=1 Tax=Anguilla anguilla TaxID=7936 RepID=A0A0E9Q646_ANGAN